MARESNLNEDGQAQGNENVLVPDEAYLTSSDSADSESWGERSAEVRAYADASSISDDDLSPALAAEGDALLSDDASAGTQSDEISDSSDKVIGAPVTNNVSEDDTVVSEDDTVVFVGGTVVSVDDTVVSVGGTVVSEEVPSLSGALEDAGQVILQDDSVIAEDSGDWTENASSEDFIDLSDSDPAAE